MMKIAPLSFVVSLLLAGGAAAAKSPNIVMIISDDQAWTDYGFMGHDTIQTPRIDQLAKQSLVFRRGYVPSSLCRPSLATLATGLYPHQHKITGNDPLPKKPRDRMLKHIKSVPTLPKMLAEKGYRSLQTGKWWEGAPGNAGFTSAMTHGDVTRGGRHGDVGLKIGREGLKPIYDFIDDCGDDPFFIWYAPFLPHTPHNPPERLLRKYATDDRPLPIAKYYAMCEWFDETCGELLAHLDEKGLAEDTIVIYVTDNGWINREDRSAYAPRSKRSPHEGGVRTPIMVRWPGEVEPMESGELASSIDLVPTILAACEIEATDDMQGVNLLNARGGEELGRDTIYGEIFAHDIPDIDDPVQGLQFRWCIEGEWKLILPKDGESPELYDLGNDPHETINLAEKHGEIVERLTKKIDAWWSIK
jgi:arylsulfatase A-like enzyme